MNKNLKVAEDYVNNGMMVNAHSSFGDRIKELFERIKPRKIIETGTYLGTGTTTIIAESLKQIGIRDSVFCTIEVNPEYHAKAKKYFQQNNIEVFALNGLSVPRSMLPTREEIERLTITDIQYGDIFVDHREQNRAEFYQRETNFPNVPDNLLYKSLEVFDFKPDFVLLDSAGHMGSIEFDYLIKHLKGECYIALDDIFHIKHHSDFRKMQSDERFEIIVQSDEKFGFCIARFDPAGVISGSRNTLPSDKKKHFKNNVKLKLLLVYSLHPANGKITLPEWIKETLRCYYSDTVEVFACGPFNEINVPDGPDFYSKVADVVKRYSIDVLWDIEGGAASADFMFKRFPDSLTIPKVFWAIDTHQFLPAQIEKSKHFDMVFSAQKNAVSALGPHTHWLPAGAAMHEKDYGFERTIDVGFIGSIVPGLHGRRKMVIEYLKNTIPGFAVFNNVFLEEKAKLSSRMKIMINVSLNNDINFRIFETLACGAMLITDKIRNNGLDDLFKDGEHLVTFDSEQELAEKINYYLKHEDERIRIAEAGKAKVLELYTHKTIVGKALDLINTLINEKHKHSQPAVLSDICWCGGKLHDSVHPLYFQCELCGTHVVRRKYSPEELRKFYTLSGYWNEHQIVVNGFPVIAERAKSDFNDRIPYWFELVRKYHAKPKSLLEIGCAHGGFLYYCRERGIQDVVGIEVDEETCKFAREYFKLSHVYSGLFPDVKLPITSFDVITGFDVLEHFADPVAGITAVTKYLSGDGTFVFQTPCYKGEANTWAQFKPIEHIFLFNESSIKKLFLKCGLEITDVLPGYFPDDMFVVGHKVKLNKNISFSRTDSIVDVARSNKAVEKVLIVRPDAIGDFVIFSIILPYFRTLHPEAKISILLQDNVAQLAQNCPYIDEIITFKESLIRDSQYRSEVLAQLKSGHFDIAYYPVYSRSEIGDLFTLQSGAARKVAFEGDCSNLPAEIKCNNDKNYDMLIPNTPGLLLEMRRNLEFMKGLGIDIPDSQGMCMWLNQKDDDYVVEILKGLNVNNPVMISPFARYGIRDWPTEKWAQLISHYPDESILICGGPEDYERAQALISLSSHRHIYNLCGKTTLSQTAALMSHCKLFVGAETGPAHMAVAANIPNVVLMGGGHYGRFMPHSPSTIVVYCKVSCMNCNWRCRFGTKPAPCIMQISVPTVVRAVNIAVSQPISQRKEPLVIAEPLLTQISQITENSFLDRKPANPAVSYELVREKINKVTGFLVQDDERFLFEVAKSLPDDATIVEIGSFKGRSTCCLAYACLGTRKKVYSIDLCFANASDFAKWKENVGRNGLLDYVTPIAGDSRKIAAQWDKSIDFIFIDGSHSYLPVLSDFIGFYPWVKDHGVIAFHDVGPGFTGPMKVVQENAKPLLYDTGLCGGIAFGRKIPVDSSLNKTKPAAQLSIAKYHTRDQSLPSRHPLQIVEFNPQAKRYPVSLADAKAHKVLIVHTGSAGDVMLLMSTMHVYRKKYSNSHIAVCVEEKVAEIALTCPYIDEVITFNADAAQKDTGYLNRLASEIRSRKFDVAIHPVYSRTRAGDFITLESGAKEKLGFDNTEGEIPSAMRNANNPLYTKLVRVYEPGLLEIAKYGFFTQSVNIGYEEPLDSPLWVTSEDVSYVDNYLRTQGINNPIVVHPFSNDATTQWPAHNWTKLISHYKDYPIIITGRKEDREKGDAFIRDLQQQNVYNMCGQLTLRQSAVLLHKSRLCVTSESDDPHFACAVNCPNVVVTSGGQFGRYLPYSKITTLVYVPMKCFDCKGICFYSECFCITRLKAETVRKAIDECLGGFPKDYLPLLPQMDSVSVVVPKPIHYSIEEVEPVRDMYRRGLQLMKSNDIASARSVLEMVVNRLKPFMAMGVHWKTAGEGGHYYDTVKCYMNACTTLAQCYMQSGELGKIKGIYQHLLENKVLEFSNEQISAFRNVVAKLQKVEPDNSLFVATPAVTSQIVESTVSRPSETTPKYLVSAIVSAYNSEKYIRGCLEDLESQTIADKLEIIVVDSGSQQNEAAIVKEFQQRYKNIKYIRTERETIYGAWNRGIKAASGKYITNSNTDDRHYRDSLEKLVDALEQNPRKVIAYGSEHVTSILDGPITGEFPQKDLDHFKLLSGLCIGAQPVWRRDLHNAVGYFDEQFFCSGDYEFWIRATQRFEMLYVNIFSGKRCFNESVVSLANKNLQTLENSIIAQSYEYAMQTGEQIGKLGISNDPRMADWPEIRVWKRRIAAKLAGKQWQPSDEMVNMKDTRDGRKPKLSIVVIETQATQWQCIRSLTAQKNQDFELIIIAYNSIPREQDLASFAGRVCIIQLKEDIGISFARNSGIACAKGDFIAYLDSSMKPNPGWVESVFRQFADSKVMAVRGQTINNNDSAKPVETQSYITIFKCADNCAFRTNILLEARGFNEDLFALEGLDLSYRIYEASGNYLEAIRFEPGMTARFDDNISEQQRIIQSIRNNRTFVYIMRKVQGLIGYIEFFGNQNPASREVYDADYDKIIEVILFLRRNHYDLALKHAEKVVTLDPKRLKGRYLLGCLYAQGGRFEEAAVMLDYVFRSQLQDLDCLIAADSDSYGKMEADFCLSIGTQLAECYSKCGQYGKLKELYSVILSSPKLKMPQELRASIEALLVKLQNAKDGPVRKLDTVVKTNDKKNNRYLVSAIVSTYNSETFIRGCLEDIENQTIADKVEIIVINSGSQQNEEAIVKEFQKKYDNIVYIKTNVREGLYSAWNRAIKAASGQFLANANTDDRHRKDAFEILAGELIANPETALVYGDQIITDTVNPTFENHHAVEIAKRAEFSPERLLFGCCVGSQPMWRKSLHNEIGGFDETLDVAADWDFWLKAAQKYDFKHIPEALGLYYRNEQGLEHGQKIHSFYERYLVGKRYGNPYISIFRQFEAHGNPLVSVVMPAYNAAGYIRQAIESVLIQNYRNFEIIVVDDGSTDETADIVRSFKNEPIQYLFKENGGVASARNLGVRKARGSFVIMLDSDDMMTPDYIASHLQKFEQNPKADMVYCDDLLIDENNRPIRVITRPEYSDQNMFISDMFKSGFPVVHFKHCIRRNVFEKLGPYDEKLIIGEDYDMMRRFAKEDLSMAYLQGAFYLRRMASGSLTKNSNMAKAKSHFDVIGRFTETFTDEQLFPDVRWDKLPAGQREMLSKCRTALVYLGIGEQYLASGSMDFAEAAFDMASEQLDECCKIDPEDERVRGLREKCRFIKESRLKSLRQPTYQPV